VTVIDLQAPGTGGAHEALALGYDADDLRRLCDKAEHGIRSPADVRRVIDRFGYLADWRTDYRVQSVRASLRSDRITCIDAAVLAYGLLEWLPGQKRKLLAIHRRDAKGEECGHCVALFWAPDGRVGALSKSSFAGLGHRDPVFADEGEVASSYARGYLAMGITPLYFGTAALEDIAGGLDWRFSTEALNELSERIQSSYAYSFATIPARAARAQVAVALEEAPRDRDLCELLARTRSGSDEELASRAVTFYRGRTLIGTMTRGELADHVDRLAAHLVGPLGVRRGDRVALLAPNSLEIPALVLAILRLGAALVPLNPSGQPDDWAYIMRHARVRGLLAPSDLCALGSTACADGVFIASIQETWRAARKGPIPDDAPQSLANALAVVLYTSGTTGNPKGVALSHENLLANARSMAGRFRLSRTTQLAVLPLYHAHAFGFGLLTSLLAAGHLVFTDRLDPFAWADVVCCERVEVTSVVPTLLPSLLAARVHRNKVPTLRAILVSSAPLDPTTAWAFEEQTEIPLVHGWGLSEYTNFACCLSPDDDTERHRRMLFGHELCSVGPALAPTEVSVRSTSGSEVGEGEVGELWVRGPSRMIGYLDDAEATRAAITDDDWLRTGDEGFFVEECGERVFFVAGRIKEIICRGGEKLSPLAIERKLCAALPECAGKLVVVGFPHRVHGEEIGAYLEASHAGSELQARLVAALGAMPPEVRPKVVLVGAAPIPRTHTGKVQRRKLVHMFERYDEHRGAVVIQAAKGAL
jgi:long-chain acyl-CoA synthetase